MVGRTVSRSAILEHLKAHSSPGGLSGGWRTTEALKVIDESKPSVNRGCSITYRIAFVYQTCWIQLLLFACAAFTLRLSAQPSTGDAARTILLWDGHATRGDSVNQQAFETALQSMGFHPAHLHPGQLSTTPLDSNTLLVVPHAAATACTPAEVAHILRHLRDGLSLVADGESPLSRGLGLKLGRPVKVSRIRDWLRPDLDAFWSDSPRVPWIASAPPPAPEVVFTDRPTGHPLAILMQVGKGRCLYLAPLFDPKSGRGYGRFASLPDAIVKGLGRIPLLVRKAADAYFDAGYRTGQSPDSLAAAWRRWGIRIVHTAAWYIYDDPPYDYQALIDACHRSGILVYAWLEWPYVGKGFWDHHPEWRQKTALLKDAHFDFLYLMDLRNPDCMNSALADLDSLLTLDWDGVDVAEFTLTGAGKHGLQGPARPDWFTGFTDYCRGEFKREQGFDPLDFFDRQSLHYWKIDTAGLQAFYRYRIQVNASTQHLLFAELDRINKEHKKSWELILTIVDNSLHPEFDDLLGFDMNRTLNLLKEFDVTLQVEDPYLEWMKPPERYIATGEYYRRLLGDRPFLIDVNVVPMKPDRWSDFSTWQPIGTEVFQYWKHAAAHNGRACFYCESSVAEKDWELMPYAMAAEAMAFLDSTGWRIDAPWTVVLRGARGDEGLSLDDKPWSACDASGVIIPAGSHRLRRTGMMANPRGVRLSSITGELLNVRSSGMECVVEYTSRPRCALSFSCRPARVSIDGVKAPLPILMNGETSTIIAPPGRHTIVVSLE